MKYNQETYETIKERILSNMTNDIDKREGSFVNNMMSPVSTEFAKYYIELDDILAIMFLEDATNEYLDKKVNDFAVYRKQGTSATGTIQVKGSVGTYISKGTVVLSQSGLEFYTLEDIWLNEHEVDIPVEAAYVGDEYNIIANSIDGFGIDIASVEYVRNNDDFEHGTDVETDEELKERFFEIIRRPATSGNVYHYEQWAKEIDGINQARVKPLWNGPGTVKVIVLNNNDIVEDSIVEACKIHIEKVRPIGAEVTVITPGPFDLSIAGNIEIKQGYDKVQAKLDFESNLLEYLRTCDGEVTYTKVASCLGKVEGIEDYNSLTVNGGTQNLFYSDEQMPKLRSIILDEGALPPPLPPDEVPVTGVTLNKDVHIFTQINTTLQLIPTIVPANATNKTVIWSSNNNAIAIVSSNGLVTSKGNGNCIITCTTEDGNKVATCNITVNVVTNIPVTNVTLSKTVHTFTQTNTTLQLSATVLPTNATNKNVTWSSSRTSVATVSSNGLVTSKGNGNCTITCTTVDGNKIATCSITVNEVIVIPVTSVTLSKVSHVFTQKEATLLLTSTILPSDATNKNVTWSSSNTNVATVSNGLVTSKGNGACTITCTTVDGNKMANCRIDVDIAEEVPDAYVTLSPTAYTITNDTLTVQFTTNKTVKGVKLNITGDANNFPYSATSYTQTSATFNLSSVVNGEYTLRIQVAY